MARPLRVEFEGAVYHLCARGNERQKTFRDDRDRRAFLEFLSLSGQRYQVDLLAFVLMSNHFHLIARTQRANLSRWMHWLMVRYTVYFNWRHRRSGHLFQGRYKSFLVESEGGNYLLNLSRYIHLNPVRGKTLGQGRPDERRQRLRAYRWSSFPGYAGLRKQLDFVDEEQMLAEMTGSVGSRRPRYRRFVEEGLLREIESPWELIQWQSVLGSESFLRRIQDYLRGRKKERSEITGLRQSTEPAPVNKILQKVARHYGVPVKHLRRRRSYGLTARNVAMAVVWEKCGLSLREVGEWFGGLDYAAVAQRLRRLKPVERKAVAALLPEC